MKTTLRWLGIALGFGLLLLAGFAVFVAARGVPHYAVPVVAAPTLTNTPAQVELGEHLVRASCAECHLNKQTNRLSGHQLLDTPPEFGALYSSNITQSQQHGIGAWTDAEIAALLRTGVGRDGRYRLIIPITPTYPTTTWRPSWPFCTPTARGCGPTLPLAARSNPRFC